MTCVLSVLASREGCAGVRRLPLEQRSWVTGMCLGFYMDRETWACGHVLFGGTFILWDYRSTQKCLGFLSCLSHDAIWGSLLCYCARSLLMFSSGWRRGTFLSMLNLWLPLYSCLLVLLIEAQKNIESFSWSCSWHVLPFQDLVSLWKFCWWNLNI